MCVVLSLPETLYTSVLKAVQARCVTCMFLLLQVPGGLPPSEHSDRPHGSGATHLVDFDDHCMPLFGTGWRTLWRFCLLAGVVAPGHGAAFRSNWDPAPTEPNEDICRHQVIRKHGLNPVRLPGLVLCLLPCKQPRHTGVDRELEGQCCR